MKMDNCFGLSEFIGSKEMPEVPCVLKRLYSDFIVIEIPSSGVVLQSNIVDKKTAGKRPLENNTTADIKDSSQESKRLKSENGSPKTKELSQNANEIPKALSNEDMQKIDNVANSEAKVHSLDVNGLTKEERKSVHEFIRRRYAGALMANSKDGIMEFRRINKNSRKVDHRDRRGKDADEDEGRCPKDHSLSFTMTKENKDTFFAINVIAKLSGLRPSMFSVAGTKDRRAITTQLVSVMRVSKGKLRQICSKLRGIWIDNFHYSTTKLQLGSLWGNHFEIVLRDIDINQTSKDELARRVDDWLHYGFLNYFGHQRFGSCGVNTADIGRYILAGQWENSVNAILKPRNGAHGDLARCLVKFSETHDAKLALNEFHHQTKEKSNKFSSIEASILNFLKTNPKNFKGAILNLARDMRSLYVHAYQSFVFNTILSKRVKKFGTKVIEGDLNLDGKIIKSWQDAKITDVFLPLPSLNDNLPKNEVGQWYKEIAEADGISKESFTDLEQLFIIGNVYRPIIIKPANVSWELISYENDRQVLQSSPFMPSICDLKAPIKEPNVGKVYFALKIKFDLPVCSYATVALRELLRTDLSKSVQKNREEDRLNSEECNDFVCLD